eukprot:SAG11_NODE_16035_length_558_cov_5.348584_1_plen_54_part_01
MRMTAKSRSESRSAQTHTGVEDKVTQLIADGHDNRLRGLALLAGAHGDEVTRRD